MLLVLLSKESHNSHLPPSSDWFVYQAKSVRKKSGKNLGGEPGHPGKTLMFSLSPDEVMLHLLDRCPHRHRQVFLAFLEDLRVPFDNTLTCPPFLLP